MCSSFTFPSKSCDRVFKAASKHVRIIIVLITKSPETHMQKIVVNNTIVYACPWESQKDNIFAALLASDGQF